MPRLVVERLTNYLCNHNANTHWAYPSSAETDAMLEDAREAFADFLNAKPDEIAFGANMTTLTFHLARALSRHWVSGDEVVVTELDHHANVGPWMRLAMERGIAIRAVRMVPQTGQLDWADLERAITPRTKLLAIGGASNALGTINNLSEAVKLAHAAGAMAFIDAVHYAPHNLVDVKALDCDFLCCSAYKFYGPHIGVMYGRREQFKKVDFPKLMPAPDTIPEVAETGTLNHEGIAGAAAAVEFLASLAEGKTRRAKLQAAYGALHDRSMELVRRLWDGLSTMPKVKLYGPDPDQPRTPTVSFTVDGVASSQVSRKLAERAMFVSHGDFYAKTVIDRLGLQPEGLVRVGCACYASTEEVERLLETVATIAK